MSTPLLSIVRTPQKPGPGPMPDALLRALDLTIGRRIQGLLAGDFRSAALGQGTELAQMRLYEPGDDVRQIDWNLTARTGQPHVRMQIAERMLTTWVLLDTSPSMRFGTADRRKADVAEGVAVAMGHVATRRGNALGVLTFGDDAPQTITPAQGRRGMLGLLTALRGEEQAASGATSLGEALGRLNRMGRYGNLVIVVSDFRGDPAWRLPLLELTARHTVIAVEIRDPREQELPNVGEIWMRDPETGRSLRVDTGRRDIRERFAQAATNERADVARLLTESGARHLVLSTSGDWLRPFASFLLRKDGFR
ncbi:MAG: DUF58 domain-containing protein [Tepidiformaceae bacterium]